MTENRSVGGSIPPQALAADRAKVIDLPTPCSGEGSNNEDRNWH